MEEGWINLCGYAPGEQSPNTVYELACEHMEPSYFERDTGYEEYDCELFDCPCYLEHCPLEFKVKWGD